MKTYRLIFLNAAFLTAFFFQCNYQQARNSSVVSDNSESAQSSNQDVIAGLLVSDFHFGSFSVFDKQSYNGDELETLVSSILEKGDRYCEMIHRRKPYNTEMASQYVRKEKLAEFRREVYAGSFYNLQAGCWNFYIMNDLEPFLDLRLFHSIKNKEAYDCYTVGFMQPYLMNRELPCKSITMVDVDIRIHTAHYEVYKLAKQGRFSDREETIKAIQELNLGWIAFSGNRLMKRNPVVPSTLCRKDQNYCLEALVDYGKSISKERPESANRSENYRNQNVLKQIQMQITPLHLAVYKAKAGQYPVIYLSNAVEEFYTTRKQFDTLLSSVRSQWPEAFMIYHAAGTRATGLYKVSSDSVETVCKDTYKRVSHGKLQTYTTFFEQFTKTKNPPACASVIQKRGLRY